ncbi:FtsX-like permease family protein [Nonomuraea insulae]|uniref:FtsX-like permease family protein n=1 Tax=Nonomuraea insulae TaxID=1616787 RepID=A0ABW1D5N7_9ACTN
MKWRLALGTIRAHRASHLASASVMATGTALLAAFASLLETGLATGRDSGFLITLPAILGGWTVAFGVVSTVSLTIEHRERELALLRSIAATPRQIRQSVVLETVVVALPAIALGLLPGVGLGSIVLGQLVDDGLVGPGAVLESGRRPLRTLNPPPRPSPLRVGVQSHLIRFVVLRQAGVYSPVRRRVTRSVTRCESRPQMGRRATRSVTPCESRASERTGEAS